MRASRISDAQKAFILKQGADGLSVADICRKIGISLEFGKKAPTLNVGFWERRTF